MRDKKSEIKLINGDCLEEMIDGREEQTHCRPTSYTSKRVVINVEVDE